jgi:uncharacterized membrane protein YvlD (DUF360 family)
MTQPRRARRRTEAPAPLLPRLRSLLLGPFRVAASYPAGPRRLVQRVVTINVVDATVLWLIAGPLPGVDIPWWPAAFAVTVVAAVISVVVRPLILFVASRFGILAFLLTIGLTGASLRVAAAIVPGAAIASLPEALLAAIGVAIGNTIVTWLLSLNGDDSFYGYLEAQLARDRGLIDPGTDPGLLVIQIDGLSAPVLESAVRTGRMPYVAGLIRGRSHRLVEWRCQVPSMTSASQAGILFGSADDIPAFRWYEKASGRLVVSNRPADAAEMERRLGNPSRDLLRGGTSVSNIFSGGADRSVLTTSTLELGRDILLGSRASSEFFGYLVDPYSVLRGLVMTIGMVILEWYQARREIARDVRPRMDRGGMFPILRAVSSIFLRDLATAAVIEDLERGAPIVYVDLLNYDEIAHHAAPERGEAMRELESVDRQIRVLAQAAATAPRPYALVVLSDHGQSVGPTFRDRTGLGLDELIGQLMAGDPRVASAMTDVESYGRLNTLLTSMTQAPGLTGRAVRRALRGTTRGDVVEVGPASGERLDAERQGGGAAPDLVACASGNLALLSFTTIAGRATLEELEARYPQLVARLASWPGIGFVLVRSALQGPLVIGPRGIRALRDDLVSGEDPLALFGEAAADDLRRLDAMSRVGDLVVNSELDPVTGDVNSFERLIGCHGGFGGAQTRPFVLIPESWDVPTAPLVGGAAVNELLLRGLSRGDASAS